MEGWESDIDGPSERSADQEPKPVATPHSYCYDAAVTVDRP